METQSINLFIVDDDKLLAADLKNYLQKIWRRFENISLS